MIANGLKMGLSFDEMNELRVRDFIKLADIYTGKIEQGPRMATQEDIDRLFGR